MKLPAEQLLKDLIQEKEAMMRELEKIYSNRRNMDRSVIIMGATPAKNTFNSTS